MTPTYATVTYKGEVITYELLYELEDAVAEIDEISVFDDDARARAAATAARLDAKAVLA